MPVIYPRALVELHVGVFGVDESHVVLRAPSRVRVSRRSHDQADACEVTLMREALPLDPRSISGAFMVVWLGDVQPGDLPIDSDHNLRFMGFVDSMKSERTNDGAYTVTLDARDLSSLLREVKSLPEDARPRRGQTLVDQVQNILDSIDGADMLAIDVDDEGSLPATPARWPDAPLELPDGLSAWGIVQHLADRAGKLVSIDLDRVVFRNIRSPASTAQEPVTELVFGIAGANLKSLSTERKFVHARKPVQLVSIDSTTRERIEVVWPSGGLPSRRVSARSRARRRPPRARTTAATERQVDVVAVTGTYSRDQLEQLARSYYAERNRQDVKLEASSPLFAEPLLSLQFGDRVALQLNPALVAGMPEGSTQQRVRWVAERLGFDDDVAELLVRTAEDPLTDRFAVEEVTLDYSADGECSVRLELQNLVHVVLDEESEARQ